MSKREQYSASIDVCELNAERAGGSEIAALWRSIAAQYRTLKRIDGLDVSPMGAGPVDHFTETGVAEPDGK